MNKSASFYWYDYETFGLDPKKDRIAQFAGIRTDYDFNIIDEPLMIYCKAADDVIPVPEACMVTGLTPQITHQKGLLESDFIERIHNEFSAANTCVVGFNNLRFDDEFTRYTLYRNFFDPYAREWQNGCSRWDIIDLVRVTRALRPDGIVWPFDDEGIASNRLELITQANNISHEAAHDALSDVYATIAVAKLIKEKQPRLYDYVLQHKHKNKISELLNLAQAKPVLHSSGMFPTDVCNTAMVIPLIQHPTNKNGVIVYDLRFDPSDLINLDAETIRQRLYTTQADLAEGESRIHIKTIHINKCPVVTPLSTLDEAAAERTKIDKTQHLLHLQKLNEAKGLAEKLVEVFSENPFEPLTDPDQSLYSGGFFSYDDKARMQTIRKASPEELAKLEFNFDDGRLDEMLFRFRARNYPHTLSADEQAKWHAYKVKRFTDKDGGGTLTLQEYRQTLTDLMAQANPKHEQLLHQLQQYGDTIEAFLNQP